MKHENKRLKPLKKGTNNTVNTKGSIDNKLEEDETVTDKMAALCTVNGRPFFSKPNRPTLGESEQGGRGSTSITKRHLCPWKEMQPDVKTKNASRQIIQRKYQFYEESLKDKMATGVEGG